MDTGSERAPEAAPGPGSISCPGKPEVPAQPSEAQSREGGAELPQGHLTPGVPMSSCAARGPRLPIESHLGAPGNTLEWARSLVLPSPYHCQTCLPHGTPLSRITS